MDNSSKFLKCSFFLHIFPCWFHLPKTSKQLTARTWFASLGRIKVHNLASEKLHRFSCWKVSNVLYNPNSSLEMFCIWKVSHGSSLPRCWSFNHHHHHHHHHPENHYHHPQLNPLIHYPPTLPPGSWKYTLGKGETSTNIYKPPIFGVPYLVFGAGKNMDISWCPSHSTGSTSPFWGTSLASPRSWKITATYNNHSRILSEHEDGIDEIQCNADQTNHILSVYQVRKNDDLSKNETFCAFSFSLTLSLSN